MFCTQCGTENRNDRKFCTNCGASLLDYTKPREDLVMPDDVKKEQELVKKRNLLIRRFNIALAVIMLFAIGLTISTFIFSGRVKFIVGAISLFTCLVFIIVWRVKVVCVKKYNK